MRLAERGRTPPSERDVTPGAIPDVPPSRAQPQTHDFTLQAVIEMQRTLGDVAGKVDRLIADTSKHSEKIADLRETLSFVRGIVLVFGILGVLVMPVATWLLNRSFPTTSAPATPIVIAAPPVAQNIPGQQMAPMSAAPH